MTSAGTVTASGSSLLYTKPANAKPGVYIVKYGYGFVNTSNGAIYNYGIFTLFPKATLTDQQLCLSDDPFTVDAPNYAGFIKQFRVDNGQWNTDVPTLGTGCHSVQIRYAKPLPDLVPRVITGTALNSTDGSCQEYVVVEIHNISPAPTDGTPIAFTYDALPSGRELVNLEYDESIRSVVINGTTLSVHNRQFIVNNTSYDASTNSNSFKFTTFTGTTIGGTFGDEGSIESEKAS